MDNNMFISIVVPIYNEAGNIKILIERINSVFVNNDQFEILFVNDGSTDDTLAVLRSFSQLNSNVKYISFSRNFGHQNALRAGLDHAVGDCVISMDGDLQHPPEVIPELIVQWKAGYDVVYTIRKENEVTGFYKQASSNFFYKLLNYMSDVKIEKGSADFRLLDKKVVLEIIKFKENPIFFRGLVNWVGFKQIGIDYFPDQRNWGETKYSLKKMIKFALLGITSFSIKPLHFSTFIGVLVAISSFLYGIYAIIIKFFTNQAIPGWTSILIVITFLGGLQLIMIGILGEYLGKLFIEAKNRPAYIINEYSHDKIHKQL
jgi:dolichol-phosphate mannosyltransferase